MEFESSFADEMVNQYSEMPSDVVSDHIASAAESDSIVDPVSYDELSITDKVLAADNKGSNYYDVDDYSEDFE